MFAVSGRSIYGYLASSSIDPLAVDVAVQIAVDHQRRRVIAGAQADDRQQREPAVGARLSRLERRAAPQPSARGADRRPSSSS